MQINLLSNLFCAFLVTVIAPGVLGAQTFDCAAYEKYAGVEPPGYAEACLEDDRPVSSIPAIFGQPGDTAFAHELRNTRNTVIHAQQDLSDHSVIGLSTSIVFGYDYSPDLTTIYGINSGTSQLGTSDGIIFTPVGTPTRPDGHTWSGLAIDPVSGEAFLSSTDSSVSTLQSVNLTTGESTLIGNIGGLELVIEIAINCEGAMYAHDIGSDAIYTIDKNNGTPTLVGPHGLKTNFAQGMDFSNQTGELYIYAYTGGGSVTYGTVSLVDGSITPLNINDPVGEWEGASQTSCPGMGPARFKIDKDFNDDNPAAVEVGIQCSTGLPLSQYTTLSEGDGVTFVVGDFADGELTCEITESVPVGYTATYSTDATSNAENCRYEEVEAGSFHACVITNSLEAVDVEVTKVWIDENPQFDSVNHAQAGWACSNVAFDCGEDCSSGSLEFFGSQATKSFTVFPNWNGETRCSVYEVRVPDGNIETDDSDCADIHVLPGSGNGCTIYNTRLYAGIPTLNLYGLALMTFLVLVVSLVFPGRID